jgi:hypothetical protein
VWQTERIIHDPNEHKRAVEVRGAARGYVVNACIPSAFGYLCPLDRFDKLEAAVDRGNREVAAFNRTAEREKIKFYVLTGKIATDDTSAIRAIRSEVSDLIADLERSIASLDVDKIRSVAKRATEVGAMLTDEGAQPLEKAVDSARAQATKWSKERRLADEKTAKQLLANEGNLDPDAEALKAAVGKAKALREAGETLGLAIDKDVIETLRQSRAAYLDLEEVEQVELIVEEGRAVEFDAIETPIPVSPAAAVEIEF